MIVFLALSKPKNIRPRSVPMGQAQLLPGMGYLISLSIRTSVMTHTVTESHRG
jgi:hypothetical protein